MAQAKDYKAERATKNQGKQEQSDKEVLLQLAKESGRFSEGELSKLSGQLESESGDAFEKFSAVMTELNKTPEGQARLRDRMSERKAERLSRKYQPFFQAIMAGSDIASSLGQLRQARKEGANLRTPAMPAVPGLDPALNQSIYDAQNATYDQARVAGAARQEIGDTYAKDIALAKSIGGGQASTLGALGQVAALRKNRGAASLLPALDSIRARETGRLDNLIKERGDLSDRNYRNRYYQYMSQKDQFDKDSAAIGALGSAGRQNLRSSVQNLLGSVPGVAARVGNMGYGDKFSAYEQSLNNSITNSPETVQSPYSQVGYGATGPSISDQWINEPAGLTGNQHAQRRLLYRPKLY
jgi:hypothetical protein